MTVRSNSASFFLLPVLVLAAVGLISPAPLASQIGDSFAQPITGVLRQDRGGSLAGYRVEVSNTRGRGMMWTDVRADGSFRISLPEPAGKQYVLRVIDGHGQVVHDDIVRPDAADLEIYLNTEPPERPVSGVVSLEELRNPVPKKAAKEYQRSQKALRKPDLPKAIRHLQKAIEIHPAFAEAHNSLGVKYMMLRDYTQAAAEFEEALRLRPGAIEPLSNLGIAYHGLQRYDEAESLIRAALHQRPGVLKTRFSLALVLLSEQKHQLEAVKLLTSVAAEIPQAHLCLATVLENQAKYGAAAREVAAYLSTEDQQFRSMAEEWFENLQRGASGEATAGVDQRSALEKP